MGDSPAQRRDGKRRRNRNWKIPFGSTSVASIGKLWIEFCLEPSGFSSWGPTTPTSGCASR
jgi:hypothetical protein